MHLSDEQINQYRTEGYLLLENVISPPQLVEIRRTISEFIEQSRQQLVSNAMFDIDPSHTAEQPCVRRLKDPHTLHPVFESLAKSDAIVGPVAELLGGTVRFDHSKLNFKHPHAKAEINWHQDWAFYPHTNDDILAVGIMIEDCPLESGPLMVLPGSHKGPIYDHHNDGVFAGGVDAVELEDQLSNAVNLTGSAGSITIHHVRMLHASRNCTNHSTRPLLLFSYCAVDAFPIFERYDIAEYDSRILRGAPVKQGRMEALPFRIHVPVKPGTDSIYDNQALMKNSEGAL